MNEPIPALIASRYRVHRELGRGGMGAVYLVEHIHTGDHLALKVLLHQRGVSAEAIERFKREARAPAHIRSENVVKVTDADVAPELGYAPFLVMELLNGSDLEKLVETHGALSPATVVSYLSQAARALDKAHSIGIVHRDLKPENIFLHHREDGSTVIKILDFGISKLLKGGSNDIAGASLTSTGAVMGTPLYMTPEQGRGETSSIGPASDVWAVGLIAYRLLTGAIYWQADTIAQLMVQIMVEPMPPPSSLTPALPPAFDAWFARSCHRDVSLRWGSVGEQIAALAHALDIGAPAAVAGASQGIPFVVPDAAAAATTPPGLGLTTRGAVTRSTSGEHDPRSHSRRRPAAVGVVIGGLLAASLLTASFVVAMRRSAKGDPLAAESHTAAATFDNGLVVPVPVVVSSAPSSSAPPSDSALTPESLPPAETARPPTDARRQPVPSAAPPAPPGPAIEEQPPPTRPPPPGTKPSDRYNPAAP